MEGFILRWTLWETGRSNDPLQLSLALLDPDTWDVLMERTVQCGPFNTAEERRLELLDDARRWLRITGHQLSLL